MTSSPSATTRTPLLQHPESRSSNHKKSKSSHFARWRQDSSSASSEPTGNCPHVSSAASRATKRSSSASSRQLLCLQFSLVLLLVADASCLVVLCAWSLQKDFWSFGWLMDPQSAAWRFWGLSTGLTIGKLVLFGWCMVNPVMKGRVYLSYLLCAGFVVLLAIDSFRLDTFSETQQVDLLLRNANVATTIPFIFTVLEAVNLHYLHDSFTTSSSSSALSGAGGCPYSSGGHGHGHAHGGAPMSKEQMLEEGTSRQLQEPGEETKPKGISFVKMLYILKPYFWPSGFQNKVRACSTYLILIVSKLANLASPLYMASATNALVEKNMQLALWNISICCALTLVAKLFKELQSFIYLKVKQTAYIELATLTYEHVLSLGYDWHVRKKLGDVLRSMDRGVSSANDVVSYVFLYLFPTLAESVVVVIIFAVHFHLAGLSFVAFASLVVYAIVTVKITLWRKKFREASNKHDNEYHDKATDALINYETIKYFSNEKYELDSYAQVIQKYQTKSVSVQGSLSLLNGTQALIIQATTLAALALATPHVIQSEDPTSGFGQKLDLGAFVAISVYLNNLFAPLSFLGTIYNMVIRAVVDMQKLSELLSQEPEVKDEEDADQLEVTGQQRSQGIQVEFQNVWFHYPSQNPNSGLRDVSFVVPRATTAAFVGETGAGKTTIGRLLFRFYDCTRGKIYVNDQDIAQVTQHSLRQAIGIVPQDTVLFNDSILNNLKYGKLHATFDEIVQVAKQARIYDFIMKLPDQWDTKVGERGLKLSGGEKQRLAIARTLLKNPPIVILDEATSALDVVTEKEIQLALNELNRGNRTMLIIAHRLSTIRGADQILVMQNGAIVEQGTHPTLLSSGGVYTRLWNAQQLEHQEEEEKEDHHASAQGDDQGKEDSIEEDAKRHEDSY